MLPTRLQRRKFADWGRGQWRVVVAGLNAGHPARRVLPLASAITRRDAVTVRPVMPGMVTCQAGAGQAGLMSDGLSGLVNRIIAWADRLQRRHGVLGFPYAVVKKYGDDEGGRQAALITYYGFLSIFPLLLLGVAVLSRCWPVTRTCAGG